MLDDIICDFDHSATHLLLQAQGSEAGIPECLASIGLVEHGAGNKGGYELQIAEQSLGPDRRIAKKIL